MGAKRFVYMSTNFMPPLATQVERQTKKAAEQALTEFSQVGRTIAIVQCSMFSFQCSVFSFQCSKYSTFICIGISQFERTHCSQYSQTGMDLWL